MCFFVHDRHKKVKIAKKNIRCWKVGEVHKTYFLSRYWDFRYSFGKLYKRKYLTVRDSVISRGFHSYSQKGDIFIGEIIEAVIPRGARYYYDPTNHEYVSNKIKILKPKKAKK